MHRLLFCFLLTSVLATGCGSERQPRVDSVITCSEAPSFGSGTAPWAPQNTESAENDGVVPQEKQTNRKIIYRANLCIVVDKFDSVETDISGMVKKHDGFIASANVGRRSGKNRSGDWTVRIPVDQYATFLNAVGQIGFVESRNEDASDVTAEFFDVEARIKNQKKLEERIVKLLERPDDKIQHVIEVERELGRVREAIEQMEGRKRYLSDVTSLTTVSIDVREETSYVPAHSPTFTGRIQSAWNESLTQTQRIFQQVVVLLVRNAIGILLFLPIACIVYAVVKRKLKKLLA